MTAREQAVMRNETMLRWKLANRAQVFGACRVWCGYVHPSGQMTLTIQAKPSIGVSAHVLAWRLKYGCWPVGVLSPSPRCAAPRRCVNPLHWQQGDEAYFWLNVKRARGCWLWRGLLNPSGYGLCHTRGDGKPELAHRRSWEIWSGRKVPKRRYVLHKCDVRRCVNPKHLFLGTLADNNADMLAKGRYAFGERSGNARLTWANVWKIRAAAKRGVRNKALASRFDIPSSLVSTVVAGTSWKPRTCRRCRGYLHLPPQDGKRCKCKRV